MEGAGPASTPEVEVRRGRPEDVPAIQEFTRHTFEWGDYVADILPEWLREPGDVWVAVVSDQPVGVTHVRYLTEQEVWFEGIRVHPDFRRLGVGRKLSEAAIAGVRANGVQVCRAGIDSDNTASATLSQALGFAPVEFVTYYSSQFTRDSDWSPPWPASALKDAGELTVKAPAAPEGDAFAELALRSLTYVGTAYTWHRATRELITSDISAACGVLAIKDAGDNIRGGAWVGRFEQDEHNHPQVSVLEMELSSFFGDAPALMALVDWCHRTLVERARMSGASQAKLSFGLPRGHCVAEVLVRMGFDREPVEFGLWELVL